METFDRDRKKTRSFLISERTYFILNPNEYTTLVLKILHAYIRLRGAATDFFSLTIEDYESNIKEYRLLETNHMFESYDHFEDAIKQLYGNPNKEREVEQKLEKLK